MASLCNYINIEGVMLFNQCESGGAVMHNIRLVVVFTLLGVCSQLADADCYPGDIQFTAIVQEIYKKVTSDRISGLRRYGTLTRSQLCWMLVRNYNYGKNPGQTHTNNAFLAQKVSHHSCYNALVYTNGYDTSAGWKKWAGTLSGTWWSTDQSFSDGAKWHQPYVKYDNRPYAVQKVEFYSQWRKRYCTFVDQTGATCRYGWNQSGKGVSGVEGYCPLNLVHTDRHTFTGHAIMC